MEADWEVEIGGGAPVIEAGWPGSSLSTGYVDLRSDPERICEIAEAAAFPPLAGLLLALNGAGSPLWTSKCDLWAPEPEATPGSGGIAGHPCAALASYIDLLPREGTVFAQWQHAEAFCREYTARLAAIALPECSPEASSKWSEECSIVLVVRQAIAGEADGFGITAYLSARAASQSAAAAALASTMAAFAGALPAAASPGTAASKLQ